MDPLKIIQKYYDVDSKAYRLLVEHSKLVVKKSLEAAKKVMHLNPDLKFIEEAAMLHDIGIFKTNMPTLDCHGDKPYICHIIIGADILRKEGYPRHALVCERHISVGISKEEIIKEKLPLPAKDMIPISIEEQIICYADRFYSKPEHSLYKERTPEEIKKWLSQYGQEKVKKFEEWMKLFG